MPPKLAGMTMLTGDPLDPAIDPQEAAARRMYDATYAEPARATSPNGEITALRADPARVAYSAVGMYGGSIDALAAATNPEGSADELALAQQKVELAEVAADIGFSCADIQQLATIVARNVATPPTAEQLATNRREAISALRKQYGHDFDQALSDAKALVQRDPRFLAYVGTTGIETEPWLVGRMAELGRARRLTPR